MRKICLAVYRFRWVALLVLAVTWGGIVLFSRYWLYPLFCGAAVVVSASLEVERRRWR